jgi:fatty-acyl-CoA synthase
MGLVGFCLAPMLSQITVDYIATSTFALRPRTWLKLISEHGGTISFSPTFGYELCVRRVGKEGGGAFDLSSWRVAGIGGEMVRADVLDAFARSFASAGFDRKAFLPCYGLAEATLAVSFTPLGVGVRVDTVERQAYERTGRAVPTSADGAATGIPSRSFVAAGRPLPGYRIEIRDDADAVLPERTIGRVVVYGPSLMQEYFRDPERTQ